MKRVPWFFLCLCLTLMLAVPIRAAEVPANKYGGGEQTFVYGGSLISILSPISLPDTVLAIGEETEIEAQYTGIESKYTTTLTWKISNTNVAQFDADTLEDSMLESKETDSNGNVNQIVVPSDIVGLVGVGAGTATLTLTIATEDGTFAEKGSCTVTVSETGQTSYSSVGTLVRNMAGSEEEEEDIINITLGDTGEVVLNPYGLDVTVGGETSNGAIVSPTYEIQNNSSIAIDVSITSIRGYRGNSKVQFLTDYPAGSVSGKNVLMYLEMSDGWNSWEAGYIGAANQVLVGSKKNTGSNLVSIAKNASGYFQLKGSLYSDGSTLWTEDDYIDVSLVFTFDKSADQGSSSSYSEEHAAIDPETLEPVTETETPVEETEEPVTETETPVEETEEPVTETETPAEETEEPAETEPPVETTDPPVEETTPSDEGTEEPGSTSEDAAEQTDSETTAEP